MRLSKARAGLEEAAGLATKLAPFFCDRKLIPALRVARFLGVEVEEREKEVKP